MKTAMGRLTLALWAAVFLLLPLFVCAGEEPPHKPWLPTGDPLYNFTSEELHWMRGECVECGEEFTKSPTEGVYRCGMCKRSPAAAADHFVDANKMAPPPPEANEVAWSEWLASELGGVAEYTLPDRKRVDVLTDTLAIEVDWCHPGKVDEMLAQAADYAAATNRRPVGVMLRGRVRNSIEEVTIRLARAKGAAMRPPVQVVAMRVTYPDVQAMREQLGEPVQQNNSREGNGRAQDN